MSTSCAIRDSTFLISGLLISGLRSDGSAHPKEIFLLKCSTRGYAGVKDADPVT
jgi:hypothetical protein